MTLPNEPVPRVFILSKSSKHVVHCGEKKETAYSVKELTYINIELSSFLTCGGHSHFRRKSSLALARNSLTNRRANTELFSI